MSLSRLSYILVILITMLLQGCGFEPVYGKKNYNDKYQNILSSIKVSRINTIEGIKFTNDLKKLLNPKDISSPIKYILDCDLSYSSSYFGLQDDSSVTSYRIMLTVKYNLVDSKTGKKIKTGTLQRENSYDKSLSEFSTFISESESKDNGIKYLARELSTIIISSVIKNSQDASKSQP